MIGNQFLEVPLNSKAEEITETIQNLANSEIERHWPIYKTAKNDLRERNKKSKDEEFSTVVEKYYTEIIRNFEEEYSKCLEDELTTKYREIGNYIENYDLTDSALNRLKKELEKKSDLAHESTNVDFKIGPFKLPLYKKAINYADKHKSDFIDKVQKNVTDKINKECKNLFDLEKKYCLFKFEDDDFVTKKLSDKIDKISDIENKINIYCGEEN